MHRGRRDRAILLFLARTGARVSEAIGVTASDLHLQQAGPQVLLPGKGRRDRVVLIPQDLARSLTELLQERGLAHHAPQPIFVGAHGERLTRFGATHVVRRAAARANSAAPNLDREPTSDVPHGRSRRLQPPRRVRANTCSDDENPLFDLTGSNRAQIVAFARIAKGRQRITSGFCRATRLPVAGSFMNSRRLWAIVPLYSSLQS